MRSVIILLCALTSSLSVAGQHLTSGPKDLAVVVEILGRVTEERMSNGKPSTVTVLKAKVMLQNKISKPRKVIVMTCSWGESWVSKGSYGFGGCDNCDSNFPTSVTIPAGQSLVFYGTLYPGSANVIPKLPHGLIVNQLGFMDLAYRSFDDLPGATAVVYWSNDFTNKLSDNTHYSYGGCNYFLSKTGK